MPSNKGTSTGSTSRKPKALTPVVILVGATGVGKSEIALQLAERFNGEIVSADSRTFYRGMDIGTAKPRIEDRRRVSHHLIDVADPDEIWNVALFQKEAHTAIEKIHRRRHLPFLVGGTGQFIRAITEGWSVPPVRPDPRLREVLSRWAADTGTHELHHKLALLDLPAAQIIDPSNVRRTIRALEVIFTTGIKFSEQKTRGHNQYNTLMLGLTCPRAELYQRIDERISRMLCAGFVAEVQRLLEQGYAPELPTMSAIGYGEMVAYIQGRISLDEAIVLMKRRTRIFVRRQANWFKIDDLRIHWFHKGMNTIVEMSELIISWLRSINWNDH